MKTWTYLESRSKIFSTLDLQDETFITPSEMIHLYNEGIEEAESEIHLLAQDYFLTYDYVPFIIGTKDYPLPYNIYGNKIRGVTYANGSIIYPMRRFRSYNEFETIAYAVQYATTDEYRWLITNAVGGSSMMHIEPAARETAIMPPNSSTFTPVQRWYLRQANRIPILGEYIPMYEQILPATAVNASTDVITVSKTYVTGDTIKISVDFSGGVMPGGLTAGTVYYVISASATTIKLATTLQNAQAGTAIDITSTGSGILNISIAANQTIIDNTLIDIPEFTKFIEQWVRCRVMEKEGDPRLEGAVATLKQQRDQMVSTLAEMVPDMDNEIQGDFTHYHEMS